MTTSLRTRHKKVVETEEKFFCHSFVDAYAYEWMFIYLSAISYLKTVDFTCMYIQIQNKMKSPFYFFLHAVFCLCFFRFLRCTLFVAITSFDEQRFSLFVGRSAFLLSLCTIDTHLFVVWLFLCVRAFCGCCTMGR